MMNVVYISNSEIFSKNSETGGVPCMFKKNMKRFFPTLSINQLMDI